MICTKVDEHEYSKKVVLTGGPGVGKTSIIQRLRELKYEVRDEVFTPIFQEAQNQGIFSQDYLKSSELLHKLVEAQSDLETLESTDELLFLDRSLIDIQCFMKMEGINPGQESKTKLASPSYDLIFVIEPLPEHHYDQNPVRRQTQKEAIQHHRRIVQEYTDWIEGHPNPKPEIVLVPYVDLEPQMSIRARAQFILNECFRRFAKE